MCTVFYLIKTCLLDLSVVLYSFPLVNWLKAEDKLIPRLSRDPFSVATEPSLRDDRSRKIRVYERNSVADHFHQLLFSEKIQRITPYWQFKSGMEKEEILNLLSIDKLSPMHILLPLPKVQNHFSCSVRSSLLPSQRRGCHSSGLGKMASLRCRHHANPLTRTPPGISLYSPMVVFLFWGVTLGLGVGRVPRRRKDSLITAFKSGRESSSLGDGRSEAP